MKTVVIIQARMSSTRLPGKVLLPIAGKTMLERVTTRVARTRGVGEVVVATTTEPIDDLIVAECRRLSIRFYRGSELDVLDRYHGAARAHAADVVIRVTSDCPLVDPKEIERILESFRTASADYASNAITTGYLRGLDAEVMTMDSLDRAWREAPPGYHRVHVTPYLYQNPQLFRVLPVPFDRDLSGYRWTVDTEEDLEMVRALFADLPNDDFGWQEALCVVERRPMLASINGHVRQKQLEEG
jgi:spore coat polysaccharide biosynthesis protein SpsF